MEAKATATRDAKEAKATAARDAHKRPDRSEKLQNRKTLSLTVVKSALKKYLRGSESKINEFIKLVRQRVESVSRRTVAMSIAFLGIVKEAYHLHDDVCDVQLGDIFDQTFFRQLMVGTEDAVQPIDSITDFYRRNPSAHPSAQRHVKRCPGDRNLYSSSSKRYLTNLCNSLRMNAESKIRRFVQCFTKLHQLSEEEKLFLLYGIAGWNLDALKRQGRRFDTVRQLVHDTIADHRRVLGLVGKEDGDVKVRINVLDKEDMVGDDCNDIELKLTLSDNNSVVGKKWLRSNRCLEPLLRYNVFLSRFYESHDLKLFNIVPVSKIKSHFITIDTYVLYGILKEMKVIQCNEEDFVARKDEEWNNLFKISKLQGHDCTFGWSVDTDGISACFHFERPKDDDDGEDGRDKEAPQYTPGANDVVFGCDPGRINIYYMATVLPNGEIKTFVLTRRQYYHDSGIFNARDQSEKWNLEVKLQLNALSTVSSKGCNIDAHWDFFYTHLHNREALWKAYTQDKWSRQRLSLYGGKKRVFAKFFDNMFKTMDKIIPDCNIVVAYGSAKFAPGGKGELSVPTSRAFKECASRVGLGAAETRRQRSCQVVAKITSEFRSSKVDYRDDSVLQFVSVNSFSPRSSSYNRLQREKQDSLRGLLWNVVRGEFVSRDLNAALNIRRNLLHRPAIMNRSRAKEKLQQCVVKRIRPRLRP